MALENTTINPSDPQYEFKPNHKSITNAILVLKNISMKNRGNFFCEVTNTHNTTLSGPSYVRIKGNNPINYLCYWLVNLFVFYFVCR